jgi:O-antigen/teichoic acid export membrane protein
VAIVCGGGALLNIILNFLLIPEYSLVGAAIAMDVTFIFILIMYLYMAHKNDLKIPLLKIIIKPTIACTAMVLFVYYFSGINLYLLIGVSIGIYFGIFFLIKGFSKEEISLVKQILRKK